MCGYIVHNSSISCEGYIESTFRISHLLLRELIKELSPNQTILVLFLEKCTTKLCTVIANNVGNILKNSHLLIRDWLRDSVPIMLFIVPFPLEMYRYIVPYSSRTWEEFLKSILIILVSWYVLKYLRDCSLVFSETLHEVRGQ